jgi:hypothetical protein
MAGSRGSCRRSKTRSDRSGANPGRPPEPPLSDLAGPSVLGRFNSLIVDFYLPVRQIYFPVRPRRQFALWDLIISRTCRHRFGRWMARNRVFRSIFPSTREPDPGRLTLP